MKKRNLSTLALIGIGAGLVLGGCQKNKPSMPSASVGIASAAEQTVSDVESFYNSLSDEAKKKFDQLDSTHQKMAMEMMNQNQSCNGKNGCKGQGGAPLKDPNKAVDEQFNAQMGTSTAGTKK